MADMRSRAERKPYWFSGPNHEALWWALEEDLGGVIETIYPMTDKMCEDLLEAVQLLDKELQDRLEAT